MLRTELRLCQLSFYLYFY